MKKNFKRILVLLFVFIMILNSVTFAASDSLSLVGESALLIDYDSNRILYEKDSNKKMYPASTTKIMTAILAIENGNMDDMVEVDAEIISLTDGSHIALDYDEKMRFDDLLNGLMIASANDAALALAKHISGSIEDFVGLMNEKAKEIGAVNTHFMNPNGLHDDDHYTTAYDLSLIYKYAMQNKTFREYSSKVSYTIPPTNKKTEPRLLHTTNKFLYGNEKMELNGKIVPIRYNGIKSGKTGTTPEAKACLVSFAQRDGKKMISVVLKSSRISVYSDTSHLLDYGFDNFSSSFLGHSNEFIENLSIENGSLPYAATVLSRDVYYPLKADEKDKVEKNLKFKDEITFPIAKGDVLGSAEYYLDGDLIAKEDIISTIDVQSVKKSGLISFLFNRWYIFLIFILLVVRALIVAKKRKYRRRSYSKYI